MANDLTIGSLFAGIGGLELGLERAGLGRVVWQVEIDPFCRRVLAKHWPHVTRYEDVRSVNRATVPSVDVICGGFPCTDLSNAARGVARDGLAGDASGIWFHFARIIGELRPRFVVVENVSAPWRKWLPVVRRHLFAAGYASVPIRVRAADVGSPQGRARVFVVAYTDRDSERLRALHAEASSAQAAIIDRADWHEDPATIVGMDDGPPDRMDSSRRTALGNAVVPQCAEVIGRAIVGCING